MCRRPSILTEGENTRRFNLRPGKLSFGSGADVTLRLADDVAGHR